MSRIEQALRRAGVAQVWADAFTVARNGEQPAVDTRLVLQLPSVAAERNGNLPPIVPVLNAKQ